MVKEASTYLANWAFGTQSRLRNLIESRFPEESYRWPTLREIHIFGYILKDNFLFIIINDKFSGPTTLEKPRILNVDDDFPLKKPKSLLFIVPIIEGDNISEIWSKMDESSQKLWQKQLDINIKNQLYYLKGFDIKGNFFIPPGYEHLTNACKKLLDLHTDYTKNVFIMMKFNGENKQIKELEAELRSALRNTGLNPLRADDRMYLKDRDLWNNVCIHDLLQIWCCHFGGYFKKRI
jgi:hypothetical protein